MIASSSGRGARAIALGALAVGVFACNSTPAPNPYQIPQPGGDGGGLTFDGGGIGPDGGGGDPGVMITVRAPADGSILAATATVDVQATIAVVGGAAGAGINPQSVVATVLPSGTTASATLTTQAPTPLVAFAAGDYRGKLSLTGLRSGDYNLRVEASTTAGAKAAAQIAIKVDAGPTITVLSPSVDGHYKGMLTIEATIDSAPYGDTALPIDATVGGVPVALAQVGTSTTFRGTIDFHQPNPPLIGDQLLIIAARNARGTRSESRTTFVVDEIGPSISATSPTSDQVVGGVIKIQATIKDDAGVLPSSVVVMIGNATDVKFKLPLAQAGDGDGVYSVLFDTAKLTACDLGAPADGYCLVFPTLSFRAADRLGNETTVAYQIGIDNQPPLADLDPPMVRDSKLDKGLRCSWQFDPLGVDTLLGDMPADGCAVSQTFDLRARVEDDGNPAGGLKKTPISRLDASTVSVYVLDDTSQALTVDSNGDGICDRINPKLVPTTTPPTMNNQVLKVRLVPLKPAGKANFTPDPSLPEDPCLPGTETDPPEQLCTVNQPTIVISYAGGDSAIWTIEPVTPGYCQGAEFDTYANNIGEGWACIAVAATDQVGNTGVSAPLRVYISYSQRGPYCPAPPAGASPPPDCTGHLDVGSGTVTNTPCTSRRYAPGEICYKGDCF